MTAVLLRCPRLRRWLAGFAVAVAEVLGRSSLNVETLETK